MKTTNHPIEAAALISRGQTFELVGNPSYGAARRLIADAEATGYTVTEGLVFTAPAPVNELEAFKQSNRSLIQETLTMQHAFKELEGRLKARKEALLQLMTSAGIDKVETPAGRVSVVEGTDYDSFDAAAFKRAYPKLAKTYTHRSYRYDYLKVTVTMNEK